MTRQDIHNSDVPIICRSCEARHKGVCGVLLPEQLQELSKKTTRQSYLPDEELIPADTEVKRYANIMNGVVKLTKLMADGRQQIVGLQFAPDFMGRPYSQRSGVATEAATEVQLCSFPASMLAKLVEDNPELEHKLHEQALQELDEAREWMLTLGRKTASEKIASFLLMIATNIDPDMKVEKGPIKFDLPLKRADIADFLGLTIETVSRQITRLRKEGVIEVEHNRTVTVPNLKKLKMASEAEH